MITPYQEIRNAIERALRSGEKKFIIYPYGEFGMLTKQILNDGFGLTECYIMDNKLSEFNPNIKHLEYCKCLKTDEYKVLFTCANPDVYEDTRNELTKYFPGEIIEIFENTSKYFWEKTRCGKHSYGPLCDHWLVESVGALCSFAPGVDVVQNHALDYMSTSPIIYQNTKINTALVRNYNECKDSPWYIEGIIPKGHIRNLKRSKIGNDVWIGKNALITNGADVGNGVIAGAGAVITKDIPDYAVVVGVPARIIRYRYTKEEIEALNRIAWWDWSDEKIKENYDDFFLDIYEFIRKHDR